LYGLYIKLRRVRSPEATDKPEAAPTAEKDATTLSTVNEDVTANNRVILLEWRTSRTKPVDGQKRFRFQDAPVVTKTDTDIFFLEESDPIRLIPDKPMIRMMQYETSFGPTKKRLLKVAHITLDNRRKYDIVFDSQYWPVYEIWEMNGPNPLCDRHARVYQSPWSPISGQLIRDDFTIQNADEGDDEREEDSTLPVEFMTGASVQSMTPQSGWNSSTSRQSVQSMVVTDSSPSVRPTGLSQPFQPAGDHPLIAFSNFWQGDLTVAASLVETRVKCSLRLVFIFLSFIVIFRPSVFRH